MEEILKQKHKIRSHQENLRLHAPIRVNRTGYNGERASFRSVFSRIEKGRVVAGLKTVAET